MKDITLTITIERPTEKEPNGYIGMTMRHTDPDCGETWLRGEDAADGPHSPVTIRRVLADLRSYFNTGRRAGERGGMGEYVEVGASPCMEDCAQVGTDGYHAQSTLECQQFVKAIRRVLGEEPEGARLSIKSFPHDGGSPYREVVCYYDESLPDSVSYAFRCESHAPQTWAEAEMAPPVPATGRGK